MPTRPIRWVWLAAVLGLLWAGASARRSWASGAGIGGEISGPAKAPAVVRAVVPAAPPVTETPGAASSEAAPASPAASEAATLAVTETTAATATPTPTETSTLSVSPSPLSPTPAAPAAGVTEASPEATPQPTPAPDGPRGSWVLLPFVAAGLALLVVGGLAAAGVLYVLRRRARLADTLSAPAVAAAPPGVTRPAGPGPAPEARGAWLEAARGGRYALDKPEGLRLGRADDSDIRLDDPAVSMRHARVYRDRDGRYLIEDLGASNGLFVNGRPTRLNVLSDGVRLTLGATELIFRSRA